MFMRDVVLAGQSSSIHFRTSSASFQIVEDTESQRVVTNRHYRPSAAVAVVRRPPQHPPRCCCHSAQQMVKHSASVYGDAEQDCQTSRKLCCNGCKRKAFRGCVCERVSSSALIS